MHPSTVRCAWDAINPYNVTSFSIKFEEINQQLEVFFENELHREWMFNLIENKIKYLKNVLEERRKENEK